MKIKVIIRNLLLTLPSWKVFDQVIALIFFWVAHRRFPERSSGFFNDFLFYLKTSIEMDQPLRQFVTDKDLAKLFYRGVLLKDFAPRTLCKFNDFDTFLKADIPTVCVLKPAHLSGCIFVNSGKESLTPVEIERVRVWFDTNIYDDIGRERNYKLLKPSVICEEVVARQDDVRDYKIFCYKGEPRLIQVDVDRHATHKRRIYTTEWEPLPFFYNKPLADIECKPRGLILALELAQRLACHFEFIRVDTYLINGRVYLGELTSIPENAHGRFGDHEDERKFMDILLSRSSYCGVD